jgi:hypothetical protein
LGHANDNEVSLLLGTAAAESSLKYRKQLGGGPARGLWQMESRTAKDIFENYLRYRKKLYRTVMRIWRGGGWYWRVRVPYRFELNEALRVNDRFACAMARIHYLCAPDPIPECLVEQAEYWKACYGSLSGKRTVEHYHEQWKACNCSTLLGKRHLSV